MVTQNKKDLIVMKSEATYLKIESLVPILYLLLHLLALIVDTPLGLIGWTAFVASILWLMYIYETHEALSCEIKELEDHIVDGEVFHSISGK